MSGVIGQCRSSMFTATLSRSAFETSCKRLVSKYSNGADCNEYLYRILGLWSWVEHLHYPGLGYLTRNTLTYKRPSPERNDNEVEDPSIEDDDEASLTLATSSHHPLQVSQYVVFSPTFQVPAFYFSMHDADGSPLPLDDILQTALFRPETLPDSEKTGFALQLPTTNFPLLSQGDHPTLGTPCWYFHPCETSAAVGELLQEYDCAGSELAMLDRWLEAWFMVLGGVVDLRHL